VLIYDRWQDTGVKRIFGDAPEIATLFAIATRDVTATNESSRSATGARRRRDRAGSGPRCS